MKYYERVEELQRKNKGSIVLVRSRILFYGIGKDAVILHEVLGCNPICLKHDICKCGIPVSSIKKNFQILLEKGYSFVIYDYEKDKNQFTEINRIRGEEILEKRNNRKVSEILTLPYYLANSSLSLSSACFFLCFVI